MKDDPTYWDSKPPAKDAKVEEIEHFDARGMRNVYGRGDQFGRHRYFHMDIWKTSDERLLMRFWSRCQEIDWRSFEIIGLDLRKIPEREKASGSGESWVPRAVRRTYNRWIDEEF